MRFTFPPYVGLTPDKALKRQNWIITGPSREGKDWFYDGPVPEDLVKEALKIVEEQNKANKGMG